MVVEIFSPTVKATPNRKLEVLLGHIQRGSITHIRRLLDDWPQDRNVGILEALLPIFSADRLPPETQLSRHDIDLTSACMSVLSRTLPFDEIRPGDPRDPAVDFIIDNVDTLFSWMTLCLLQAENAYNCKTLECHTHGLVAQFAGLFMMYIHVCEKLRAAMQASPVVARFVAVVWMWTDPGAKLPLSVISQEDEAKGCLCIHMFQTYTSTEEGKMQVFEQLAGEGLAEAAAECFVLVGMGRAEGLRRKCKALQDPRILSTIAYNYRQLMEIFEGFIELGDPVLLSALSKFPFIRRFTAGLCPISSRVWTAPQFGGFPIFELVTKLLHWTETPGLPAFDGMCQLLRGGVVSLCLDVVTHAPQLCNGEQLRAYGRLRDAIVHIFRYNAYPSIVKTLAEEFSKIDKSRLERLEGRRADDSLCLLWKNFKNQPGLRLLSEFERVGRPTVCDNFLHREVSGSEEANISDSLRTCSRCHSVVYCSEKCQSVDWSACHRFDCPQLSLEYQGRRLNQNWLKASTRLFHFYTLKSWYRWSSADIGAARHRQHPGIPLEELIVSFDFINYPLAPAGLYTATEYLDTRGSRSKALGGIGRRRLEMMVDEFRTQADIRIVEGIFMLGDLYLWVVVRIRTFVDEDGMEDFTRACVLGGASYLGFEYTATRGGKDAQGIA